MCALHALRPLLVDIFLFVKCSAIQSSQSLSAAEDLNFSFTRSQTRPRRNLPYYWFALPVFRSGGLVPEGKLQSRAEHVTLCSRIHEFSQGLVPVLHTISTEHIMLHMVIVFILSYAVWTVVQNKIHIPAHILTEAKLEILLQISKVHVVNGAQESHRFDAFLLLQTSLFIHGRRRDGPTLISYILFFHLVDTCTGPCFLRGPHTVLLFQSCWHIHRALLRRSRLLHAW